MAWVAVNCSDWKKPAISSSAKITGIGVPDVNNMHMRLVAELIALLTIRTARKPKRRRIGRAVSLIEIEPSAVAKVIVPEAKAERPNTTCSNSGSRKTSEPGPARNRQRPGRLGGRG